MELFLNIQNRFQFTGIFLVRYWEKLTYRHILLNCDLELSHPNPSTTFSLCHNYQQLTDEVGILPQTSVH